MKEKIDINDFEGFHLGDEFLAEFQLYLKEFEKVSCFNPISVTFDDINGVERTIPVPCGKCPHCLSRRRSDWVIRLKNEFKTAKSAWFITLTYDDSNLPFSTVASPSIISHGPEFHSYKNYFPVVCRRDVQLFLKRLRFDIRPFKIRYFLASEYGPTSFRPHYHLLLFDFPKELDILSHITNAWNKGFVSISDVNEARILYTAAYMFGLTELPDYLKDHRPFVSCSKGIGLSYLENSDNYFFHKDNKRRFYLDGKYKKPLPKYYKDKIFSAEEKHEFLIDYLWKLEDEKVFSDLLVNVSPKQYRDLLIYKEDVKDCFARVFRSKFKKSKKKL